MGVSWTQYIQGILLPPYKFTRPTQNTPQLLLSRLVFPILNRRAAQPYGQGSIISFGHRNIYHIKGSHPKKRDFLGIFPKGGGGVFSNPKTFVNLTSFFWYAKIILRCQSTSGPILVSICDKLHPFLTISP